MSDFYDQLTPLYHLIHQDWDASIERQGLQLSALIEAHRPAGKKVLDVSCGIMRSRYDAVSTARLCELMREAGLADVRRLDGAFYQPVLIGTRAV